MCLSNRFPYEEEQEFSWTANHFLPQGHNPCLQMSENLDGMWPYLGIGEDVHMIAWSSDYGTTIFRVQLWEADVSGVFVA